MRLTQVLFVPDTAGIPLCSTCWLEANGKTPTTGDWRNHAIVTAEQRSSIPVDRCDAVTQLN